MLEFLLMTVGLSACVQVALWSHSLRTRNAGWVDFGWATGMAIGAALLLGTPTARGRVVAFLFGAWAVRLAFHIWSDRLSGGKGEDQRYQSLRAHWGDAANLHFLWFFLVQSLLVGIFLSPPLVAAYRTGPFPDVWDGWGMLILLVSVLGETTADRQLAAFRSDPDNRGRVCRSGLWKYSRHPNYFFEWVQWWGYVMMAVGAPLWILTLVGPALMYVFLRYLTGVPHAERQSLRSRGEAYRHYQQTTPVFFPWKPRAS